MTTQVPEVLTRQATVAEASQVAGRKGETQWALKLEIKDISQFPVPCYLALERASSILKGSTHLVTMRRGKLKANKEGRWASDFFWDLEGWDVQPPAAEAPRASTEPQKATPTAPVPWDAADTQSRISWAQAVNLAVALGHFAEDAPLEHLMAAVEYRANYFYPLIRKGPTALIDPETLPWDAQEGPSEATNGLPAPMKVAGQPARTLPPFPVRGEKEVASSYYLRAAKERYGLERPDALIAIGSWSVWLNQFVKPGMKPEEYNEMALQAAWRKLEAGR